MQISSRFSVAVHVLSLLALQQPGDALLTSERMAGSVNTNPVVIRRILGQLKKAGLVEVRPASGGTFLTRSPRAISLLEVYRAVEVVAEGQLFSVHDQPNPACPVGRHIQAALNATLQRAQAALEQQLAGVLLAQVTTDIQAKAAASS
ncbi:MULTISPECIES: Rrf2 family transcriptional regulator [Hymenobacter]|uniref:Rrf2 family transcriptional regulator n=1 Tax=Hymenobacter guriensis TaxID=2793065 RepID=A0ABS0L283_9BACT|nr:MULTISPECIES: Rrf2 family transcriptional regulator [Hymenobacter]MBG8554085.1 Rrf2 family transcriptional regulator [Hymenobacter guriensis]MCR5889974.1 Rrf2 family transcriptional regulator [Hymenobacter sp. J193]